MPKYFQQNPYVKGIMYHFAYGSKDKAEVESYAELMRKMGHKTKVIKQDNRWVVFRDKY